MNLRSRQNSLRACRKLLAVDLANAYLSFINTFPDLSTATIESFASLFEKNHLEYLFYSGNCTLDFPYHEWVVEEVLQLSVAYLYFPLAVVRTHVRRFGLLLVFYFYFKQPAMSNKSGLGPIPVRVASHIINDILSEKKEPSPDSEGCLVSALSGPAIAHGDEEKRIVLAMYKHRAWCLTFYDNIGEQLQALIEAHEKAGALLLSQQKETSIPTVRIPTLPPRLTSRYLPPRSVVSTNRIEFNSPKMTTSLDLSQKNSPSFSLFTQSTQNESKSVFSSALSEEIERYEAMKRSMGLGSIL